MKRSRAVEVHILPDEFMMSRYGTLRRTVKQRGYTVVQVAESKNFNPFEERKLPDSLSASKAPWLVDDDADDGVVINTSDRKGNAAFLRSFFGS